MESNIKIKAVVPDMSDFHLAQPLTDSDIRCEAETLLRKLQNEKGPNSPNRTHFIAQLSPDFMMRASSIDTSKVLSFMPFKTASLSNLNDRKGLFLLITKDENRFQPLKECKHSVRKKLAEVKGQSDHIMKKKNQEKGER